LRKTHRSKDKEELAHSKQCDGNHNQKERGEEMVKEDLGRTSVWITLHRDGARTTKGNLSELSESSATVATCFGVRTLVQSSKVQWTNQFNQDIDALHDNAAALPFERADFGAGIHSVWSGAGEM